MDFGLKEQICKLIADGWQLRYTVDGQWIKFYPLQNEYYNIETDALVSNIHLSIELPILNEKQEAFSFLLQNKNLYWKDYLSYCNHQHNDKYESAFLFLNQIFEENIGGNRIYNEFYNFLLKKSIIMLNEWLSDNRNLF